MNQTTVVDTLIVGAGLCGLIAANQPGARRQHILVVDKGRSVGGRLATRRIGEGRADHGAKFFTARTPAFAQLVHQWLADGLVFEWSRGWSDGSLMPTQPDGHPRYAAHSGMNALAKQLAASAERTGADIRTNVRLTSLAPAAGGWAAVDEAGLAYEAHTVVVTAPPPQALALLDASGVQLHSEDRDALTRLVYASCLCALLWVDGEVLLPAPGAVQQPGAPVTWIADNQRKGISPLASALTVHAGPSWSQAQYAAPDEEILPTLLAAVQPFLSPGAIIHAAQVKRWRYALPLAIHPAPFLRAQALPPLYFGGDAFGGPRMEGAVLSGLAIADALAE